MRSSDNLRVATAILLIVAASVREGLSLQCVQCDSFYSAKCEETPWDYLRYCRFNATACIKTQQKSYYDGEYHVQTKRECAYEMDGSMGCVENTGIYIVKCYCGTDGCNAAGCLSPMRLALVSGLLAFLLSL